MCWQMKATGCILGDNAFSRQFSEISRKEQDNFFEKLDIKKLHLLVKLFLLLIADC